MKRDLDRLERDVFDVLVIGGGINGAGIARDAAMRGLSVALLERDDFGDGTSSRSSRLVHGGLRYLEQFRFGLVRESLRERATLLRTAPHLVRPLPFLIPLYRDAGRGPLQLRVGLFFYDHLARRDGLPGHRMIDADEVLRMEPGLRREGLRGGAIYYDAWVDDRRLVVANVIAAARAGACVANHLGATGVDEYDAEGSDVDANFVVHAADEDSDRKLSIRARHVVNAAGPFADRVAKQLEGPPPEERLRLSQGAHLAFPVTGRDHAMLMFSPVDQRVVFVIPERDVTLLGTTEVEIDAPSNDLGARADEVEYLLKTAESLIPEGGFARDRVVYAYAGLRPLASEGGGSVGRLSREAVLDIEERGEGTFVSVFGGKITSYRALAQRVVDGFTSATCTTHRESLPGGAGIESIDEFLEREIPVARERIGGDAGSAEHLVDRYGRDWPRVLEAAGNDASRMQRIHERYPEIEAEVLYAAREEMASTVGDVLLGRLTIGRAPGNGLDCAERVSEILGDELGWDAARRRTEIERFEHDVRMRLVIPDAETS